MILIHRLVDEFFNKSELNFNDRKIIYVRKVFFLIFLLELLWILFENMNIFFLPFTFHMNGKLIKLRWMLYNFLERKINKMNLKNN